MCVCVYPQFLQNQEILQGTPHMDPWQLGGIADMHCVEGNSVAEGVAQMPLDKLQMTLATRNRFGSREVLMMVVRIPG